MNPLPLPKVINVGTAEGLGTGMSEFFGMHSPSGVLQKAIQGEVASFHLRSIWPRNDLLSFCAFWSPARAAFLAERWSKAQQAIVLGSARAILARAHSGSWTMRGEARSPW